MDALFENPLRIALYGVAIEALLVLLLFTVVRHKGMLWAIGGTLVFFAAWIGVERLVVTERERVAMALDDGITSLLTNKKEIVYRECLSPTAKETRQLVAMGLRMVDMKYAEYSGLEIELNKQANPPTAVARFVARLYFHGKTPEVVYENWVGNMTVPFRKENGRWMVVDPVEGTPLKP